MPITAEDVRTPRGGGDAVDDDRAERLLAEASLRAEIASIRDEMKQGFAAIAMQLREMQQQQQQQH